MIYLSLIFYSIYHCLKQWATLVLSTQFVKQYELSLKLSLLNLKDNPLVILF